MITGAASGSTRSVCDFSQVKFAMDERGSEKAPSRGLFTLWGRAKWVPLVQAGAPHETLSSLVMQIGAAALPADRCEAKDFL